MGISAFLNKGALLKGSSLLTGVIGVASGGSSGFGSFKYDINSISKIDFTKDKELHKLFKDGQCIQKHLPGKIENVSEKEVKSGSHLGIDISTKGFSGVDRHYESFKGTKGCIDTKIKWSDKEQTKGIMGYVELVIWNDTSWKPGQRSKKAIKDNGYAMIMRSIISGLGKDPRFLNQLTTLKENLGSWEIQNSVVWFDSTSTVSANDNKKIKLTYGNSQIFEIDWKSSEITVDPNSLVNKYEKLALWSQGQKDVDTGKLLGNLSIDIGNKNTDLWTTMDKMLRENEINNKDFAAKLFCTGPSWYTVDKFPKDHKFFRDFDTYNPGWQDLTPKDGKNHMSIHGKWSS